MGYKIKPSIKSKEDFKEYINYIKIECGMPMTAARHYDAILKRFESLKVNPFINPVRDTPSLRQFGINVRRQNFKKMAIIYTVNNNTVYIHRIIASSMITCL